LNLSALVVIEILRKTCGSLIPCQIACQKSAISSVISSFVL